MAKITEKKWLDTVRANDLQVTIRAMLQKLHACEDHGERTKLDAKINIYLKALAKKD